MLCSRHQVLETRQGGVKVPPEWCSVGHPLYTTAFGALLARAWLSLKDGGKVLRLLQDAAPPDEAASWVGVLNQSPRLALGLELLVQSASE